MCAQCFPSSATVQAELAEGGLAARRMEDLKIGDRVLTQGGFSKVFAFMDGDSDVEADFVKLMTASGAKLELTPAHIVYAHAEMRAVLADSIVEGDLLWTLPTSNASLAGGLTADTVISATMALRRGMYAPLTEDGSLVVDGVLASSYANVKSLHWGKQELVSGHDLNRYMHEPLRLACSVVSELCSPAWHSAQGRHAWTQFLLDHLGFLVVMNNDHSDLRAALLEDPSVYSGLAALVQSVIASMLCLCFGSSARLAVVLAVVLARVGFWPAGARGGGKVGK